MTVQAQRYCDECMARWAGESANHVCTRSPGERIKLLEQAVDTLQKAVIQLQRDVNYLQSAGTRAHG